jgi:hypothetical protein
LNIININLFEDYTISFNIEVVPARLTPFDWASITGNTAGGTTATPLMNNNITGLQQTPVDNTLSAADQANIGAAIASSGLSLGNTISGQYNIGSNIGLNGLMTVGNSIYPTSHPLYPLTQTNGLVFPYTPSISENLGVRYDSTDMTYTNEAIHGYKATDNTRLSLSDCAWTAETFDQAIYTLGVIHFFRSFVLMDYGRKGPGTGKPPSPMWFNAYGDFMYSQIPVLIERVDWSFPQNIDFVGIPNPGTDAYNNQTLNYSTNPALTVAAQDGGYTWVPIKFTINSISMVVQHSIYYWTNEFSLADFQSGALIGMN